MEGWTVGYLGAEKRGNLLLFFLPCVPIRLKGRHNRLVEKLYQVSDQFEDAKPFIEAACEKYNFGYEEMCKSVAAFANKQELNAGLVRGQEPEHIPRKAVFSLLYPFFKGFLSQIFHKFIRVLIWL